MAKKNQNQETETTKIPTTDSPTPENQTQESSPQLAIPKVETRGEKKPKEAFEVDTTAGIVSLDPMHNVLNVEQAMAYIATQPDPRAALDTLRRNRQLDQVTDTYIAAMDAGVIEDTREKKD